VKDKERAAGKIGRGGPGRRLGGGCPDRKLFLKAVGVKRCTRKNKAGTPRKIMQAPDKKAKPEEKGVRIYVH
jgi:hypothetical protein